MGNTNNDFDFLSFAVRVINRVDSVRAKNQENGTLESRINALYRAIGLPAVTPKKDTEEVSYPPKNNGNLHEKYALSDQDRVAMETRKVSGSQRVTVEELTKFMDVNEDTVSEAVLNRKRGTLKPMVVDNRIIITPVKKRFAPAFTKEEDLEIMDDKLNRPLIEAVISIRMRTENITNTAKQDAATIQLALSSEIQTIGDEIIKALNKSMNNISSVVDAASTEIGKVRRYLHETANAEPNNIAQENPDTTPGNGDGEIELTLAQQESRLAIKQARVALFDFDDTFGESTSTSKNLKDTFLASELLDIIVQSPTKGAIQNSIDDTKNKKKKFRAKLKNAYKDLDLVLGTFSGLSGTDILAIIISLFTVDINILVSLLNEQSKTNLEEKLGVQDITALFNDLVSVSRAVSTFEQEVVSTLIKIDDKIVDINRDDSE